MSGGNYDFQRKNIRMRSDGYDKLTKKLREKKLISELLPKTRKKNIVGDAKPAEKKTAVSGLPVRPEAMTSHYRKNILKGIQNTPREKLRAVSEHARKRDNQKAMNTMNEIYRENYISPEQYDRFWQQSHGDDQKKKRTGR